jgi:hypothetical protein
MRNQSINPCMWFIGGERLFLDNGGMGRHQNFGIGCLCGHNNDSAGKLIVFGCCRGGALMTRVHNLFRGTEISFSPCNTTKKSRPGLKMLRKATLMLLNKNPLKNLAISRWLLKMQGGVAVGYWFG